MVLDVSTSRVWFSTHTASYRRAIKFAAGPANRRPKTARVISQRSTIRSPRWQSLNLGGGGLFPSVHLSHWLYPRSRALTAAICIEHSITTAVPSLLRNGSLSSWKGNQESRPSLSLMTRGANWVEATKAVDGMCLFSWFKDLRGPLSIWLGLCVLRLGMFPPRFCDASPHSTTPSKTAQSRLRRSHRFPPTERVEGSDPKVVYYFCAAL